MNENILVVLLVVIILVLFVHIAITIAILSKLVGHFNDMDHQYIWIRTNLDHLVDYKEDERLKYLDRYGSTCNRIDAIIEKLGDICDVCDDIHEDTHPVEVAKRKDLKEKKPDDGGCRDCMFIFKNEYEEPCNKCCHAYTTQFVSRGDKK